MVKYKFTVIVERDEDGVFVASCPALQGCYTQGKTYKEAMKNIKEAIELHVDARKQLGEPIPFEQAIEEVEIVAKVTPSKA
jgi:predicted RNase H-like HicB family nuclease